LDACALIAFLAKESGYEKIRNLLREAVDKNIIIKMNQINLLEVYYGMIKVYDQNTANNILKKVEKFPMDIIIGLEKDVLKDAGRIKSQYKIPLGDSIAAAECIKWNGILVTSDHNDFEKIVQAEKLNILWFR
jgi:predicted nucleic acid-binding protein